MTPVEVMSFPKFTELAGNRLFSWALETIGMHRKGMVLELTRPPSHASSVTFAFVYASALWD